MEMDKWKERGRIPLPENTLFTLKNTKIVCQKCIGEGSSCLVYQGYILSGTDIIENTDVIIKEFYPKSDIEVLDIERDPINGMLKISERTKRTSEYKQKMEQFLMGIENQKRLSKSDAMEIAIKPWIETIWGDSFYVISNSHKGSDLRRASLDTLEEKLLVAIGVAETMDILHSAGFLLLDIKPDNLFWTKNPSMVRIIDVDSVVNAEDICRIDKNLLSNLQYASPELILLAQKMEEQISEAALKKYRTDLLRTDSNLYSMGVYLHELFWGEVPSLYAEIDQEALASSFLKLYEHTDYDRNKLRMAADKLSDIIAKSVIYNRTKRRRFGYPNAELIMKDLNEIYAFLSSEKYIPRKEIAKANGTFAAYHMLQKFPLFEYRIQKDSMEKRLEVVVTGCHMMRKDMVSALISIGQMLDTQLHIYMVSEDADTFWEQYISDECNPGLAEAVVIYKNEELLFDRINPFLTARPLAYIHLITEDSMSACKHLLRTRVGRYFIILEEESKKKEELYHFLYDGLCTAKYQERCFIGYLHMQDEPVFVCGEDIIERNGMIETVPISADSYSETYNEKMFENRIYDMGLMACAYYYGYMEADVEADMEALEKEFKEDLYGIASSERAALHSMYKIASLGISRMKPGRFLNYYRKLEDEQCLERLSWLEHLSWTAYILTSGGIPIFTKAEDFTEDGFSKLFDEYAYRGKNDWKDKRDEKHLRHPFLVAYHLNDCLKPEKGWLHEDETWPEEKVALLDPLDILSYRLNWWYKKKISCKEGEEVSGLNIDKLLRDAYKERDIKQSDRDMVFAAVDMIV